MKHTLGDTETGGGREPPGPYCEVDAILGAGWSTANDGFDGGL